MLGGKNPSRMSVPSLLIFGGSHAVFSADPAFSGVWGGFWAFPPWTTQDLAWLPLKIRRLHRRKTDIGVAFPGSSVLRGAMGAQVYLNFSSGTALSATVGWRVGFRPVVPGSRAELWILQATLPYFPRFPQNRAPRQGGGFCVFLALFLRKCLCFWEVGVPSAVANDCAGSGGNAVEGRWREGGVCAGRGCMCLLL